MQPYVTPKVGRKPTSNNIVDREDYKLSVTLTEFRPGEYQLCVDRYMQNSGWNNTQLFLSAAELNQIRRIINATE